ncbi:MAG TPA: type III-B CRISPR module RAMP protein Cmr6 [Thermoanaerobaculia bacterium]|nr:type III-B CRISPR module RAMP protein Cmr6 [Thermoanaerobaculia bacterium]
MNGRRADLEAFMPAQGTHAGLWLDQGLTELEEKGSARQEHFDGLLHVAHVPEDYRRFYQRWQKSIQTLEPCTRLAEATTLGRMVVGLGVESILETSITLHRTYGVPIIPGSALKGLAAAAAHKHLEDPDWRKTKEDGTMGPFHRILFGDTASSGYVTFHDALWIPEGERLLLDLDVMTVHHPDYYQGQGLPPADWDNPTPVAFLSARGRFLLAVTGPEDWATAALDILKDALDQDGIGAKTAAGYGRMSVTPRALPEKLKWQPIVAALHFGNAGSDVPRVLSQLTGEERRSAALAIIQRLTRRELKAKQDKNWVKLVFEAAGT